MLFSALCSLPAAWPGMYKDICFPQISCPFTVILIILWFNLSYTRVWLKDVQVFDWLRPTRKTISLSEPKEIQNLHRYVTQWFPKIHIVSLHSKKASSCSEETPTKIKPTYRVMSLFSDIRPFNSQSPQVIQPDSISAEPTTDFPVDRPSSQGVVTSWNVWVLFWGETSDVTFYVEGNAGPQSLLTPWCWGSPLLFLDPRALCSTHKCFLISFPSGSEAWLPPNKACSSHWLSLSFW